MFTIRVISSLNIEILEQLLLINKNQSKIMSQIDDLNLKISDLDTKVDGLQVSIDADQASDAQVVSDLTAANVVLKGTISDLEAQLAALNPAAIQTAIDKINSVIIKVDAATVDVSGPNV